MVIRSHTDYVPYRESIVAVKCLYRVLTEISVSRSPEPKTNFYKCLYTFMLLCGGNLAQKLLYWYRENETCIFGLAHTHEKLF